MVLYGARVRKPRAVEQLVDRTIVRVGVPEQGDSQWVGEGTSDRAVPGLTVHKTADECLPGRRRCRGQRIE
ncbi:hypothetical protein B6E66_13580 [Streptomyces maremycinicus]|nr:hypothetical protein B6E66_13580 [Streptomyces sp. B9173]